MSNNKNSNNNNKNTITRAYNFELRAENNDTHGDHITGRPIVYNSRTDLGWFDEIIEAGALDKANLKDVRFLVNHDTSMIPLARSRNNNKNSTMQMEVDKDGMGIRVDLDTENNTEAKNLYSAIKRGDISGMSFMFTIDDEEWENLESDHPTRHIRKIGTVLEVSAVTFPAYEATEISARAKEALDSAKELLDSKRRDSLDSDEKLLELEKAKIDNLFF
jgi:HK97 family phage prohead protease